MSEIKAKTIITKSKLPKVEYCFNPYIGCTVGCVYCYARFMGRFSGHSNEKWGTYFDWKINAPDLLEKELPDIKKKGGVVLLGSVTDCYQPAERRLEITRKSLEVFLKYQIPISILTKNVLAERDFDLLSQFDYCEFGMSIGVLNQVIAKVLEPYASMPEDRVALLEKAHNAGLKTYVFIGPLHPGVSDLSTILKRVAPYVYFAMGEIPNLRCGNWPDLMVVLNRLHIEPEVYKKIAESQSFYDETKNLLIRLCQDAGIEYKGVFKH
ncbi:MAG: radical SAM protein [Candidatus Omnitrophota bacterium]|nr:radical SAM protein [Candidatus Omnitrophota bacterium]